jgi:hypothetical protein
MSNKKSLLQDSLQELENIKNESLELAKEQLINESADLLEKKSAALFEKLISEEVGEFGDISDNYDEDESDDYDEESDDYDKESDEEPFDIDEPKEPEMSLDEMLEKLTEPKEKTLDEILAEIKNSEGMYDDEESDDE